MNKPITLDNLDEFVTFRFADTDDVSALVELYRRYNDEAIYKDYIEFDPARTKANLLGVIDRNDRPHILAIVNGEIAGFIAYVFNHTFSVRPFLVMMELYVRPEFRRSAIGRSLVGVAVLEGKAADACAFHAPVASGMPQARSLFNLFGKAGFEMIGYVMRRAL